MAAMHEGERVIPGAVDTRVASDEHSVRDFRCLLPRHWTTLACMRPRDRLRRRDSDVLKGDATERTNRLNG